MTYMLLMYITSVMYFFIEIVIDVGPYDMLKYTNTA